jgi:transcriptional regulator with XRE-family HTH domain
MDIAIREKRLAVGVSGSALCARAGISRSRLSDIERGYVQPKAQELRRIERALLELVQARSRMAALAKEVGWPGLV